MATGYEAEEHEVQAVWDALVGPRDAGEDSLARYVHLASRRALVTAVDSRMSDEQALLADEIYREIAAETGSTSYAKLAERLGLSASRAQQLVERARRLHGQRS